MSLLRTNLAILVQFVLFKNAANTRSPENLSVLAEMEYKIYNILATQQIPATIESRIPTLINFLTDFNESTLRLARDLKNGEDLGVNVANNPLMSYRMIRRCALLLSPILMELRKFDIQDFPSTVKSELNKYPFWEFPTAFDLEDAMEAILRIHHVFNPELELFTSGNIFGTQTPVELNAQHCSEIGEFALGLNQYATAVLWLELALKKMDKSESGSVNRTLKSWQTATEALGIQSNHIQQHNHKLNHSIPGDRIKFRRIQSLLKKDDELLSVNDDLRFAELCSDKTIQKKNEVAQLFCYLEKGMNGAWTLGPLKVEQLSKSPLILQMYNLLSNRSMKELKNYGIPIVSKVDRWSDKSNEYLQRDSVQGFLADNPQIYYLERVIEFTTGLIVTAPGSGEMIVITGYAYGGFDGCHSDWVDHSILYDNRLATVVFYLEDVELGGQTVFPRIGVSVKPLKGSALFFDVTFRNGQPDPRAYHCGCPVVLGQKWILVKHIREAAQLHTRPCSLNPNE